MKKLLYICNKIELNMDCEFKERFFVHFKGKRYKFISIARDSETLEDMVVYQALYGEYGIWVRPASMFFGKVMVDGVEVDRFKEETVDK